MSFFRQIRAAGLTVLLLAAAMPVRADIDLGAMGLLTSDSPTSPVPQGLIAGAALIGGQARYEAQDNALYAIPGFIYFGDDLMFLGDRDIKNSPIVQHNGELYAGFALGYIW
ncbi:hypothetical protein NMD14_12920 [Aeromonas veronii]